MRPLVGRSKRISSRPSVVLPEPLSPTRPTDSPRPTSSETSSSARTSVAPPRSTPPRWPKSLRTPSAAKSASAGADTRPPGVVHELDLRAEVAGGPVTRFLVAQRQLRLALRRPAERLAQRAPGMEAAAGGPLLRVR